MYFQDVTLAAISLNPGHFEENEKCTLSNIVKVVDQNILLMEIFIFLSFFLRRTNHYVTVTILYCVYTGIRLGGIGKHIQFQFLISKQLFRFSVSLCSLQQDIGFIELCVSYYYEWLVLSRRTKPFCYCYHTSPVSTLVSVWDGNRKTYPISIFDFKIENFLHCLDSQFLFVRYSRIFDLMNFAFYIIMISQYSRRTKPFCYCYHTDIHTGIHLGLGGNGNFLQQKLFCIVQILFVRYNRILDLMDLTSLFIFF